MKQVIAAAIAAAFIAPAGAGERFSGTHTYRAKSETWIPVPASGWRTVTMVGDYEPMAGPVEAGRIECRGTNYWHKSTVEADGVCVFGDGPDTWMLRYRMTRTDRATTRAEQHQREGEWTVVDGTGRFSGMTGSGTYLAEGTVAEGGMYRTRWEGEVSIPE